MKSRTIKIHDVHGNEAEAQLFVCDRCGAEAFVVFVIGGKHQHFQCNNCGTSYCDGSCGVPQPAMTTNPGSN